MHINLKNIEVATKVVDGARVTVEKALQEANAHIATMKTKLGILSVKKDGSKPSAVTKESWSG